MNWREIDWNLTFLRILTVVGFMAFLGVCYGAYQFGAEEGGRMKIENENH